MGYIELCLPVISIIEPYETLKRRTQDRKQLASDCERMIKGFIHNVELSEHRSLHATLVQAIVDLGKVNDREMNMLDRTLTDILAHAEILSLSQRIYTKGLQAQSTHEGLDQLDALIYASVLDHAQNHPIASKCFYEPDEHFSTQTLKDELKACGTRLFRKSEDCLQYVKHELNL